MIILRTRQAERGRRLAQRVGHECSMSSVVRTTTGITITASATRAGPAGEMAHRRHHDS